MRELIEVNGDNVEVYRLNDNLTIKVKDFEERFGGVYYFDVLYNHANATKMWKEVFKNLKEKGKLT